MRSTSAHHPVAAFWQFLLYSAAGSLIWNTVLVSLGVWAGNFIQENLKYIDYAVVAVFALGLGFLVYKRAKDVRRHRRARTTADRQGPSDGEPDRPAA